MFLGVFLGSVFGMATIQTDQNRAVERKCNLETHKLVYVKNAVVDQAVCIKSKDIYLLPKTQWRQGSYRTLN